MRKQYLSLRALRSNLIVYLITFSLTLGLTRLARAADYTFITIDFPDAVNTLAWGINNKGEVVGHYDSMGGKERGFLLSKGKFTTIHRLLDPCPSSRTSTALRRINDNGLIAGVGYYVFPNGRRDSVLLYGNTVFDLFTVSCDDNFGGDLWGVRDINGKGQILGSHELGGGGPSNFCLMEERIT